MMTGRDSRLLAEQRRRKILELIEQKGQITVRELVERFAVSSVTARGDLDACAHRAWRFDLTAAQFANWKDRIGPSDSKEHSAMLMWPVSRKSA